jgi:hypothetical protein
MSLPEFGFCRLDEYEIGKAFIVAPDRLCIEGVYTFAYRARQPQTWEAYLLPVLVRGVRREPDEENPSQYLISMEYGESSSIKKQYADRQGMIRWLTGASSEGYLRHRFDGSEDELVNLSIAAKRPIEIFETDKVLPPSV